WSEQGDREFAPSKRKRRQHYLTLTVNTHVRINFCSNGEGFFARSDTAGWAPRYVSLWLSRSERSRYLPGRRCPGGLIHQPLPLKREVRGGSARTIFRLFEGVD